ncbi:MAG: ParB/RepB/Spo0J family partition protein [Candidatus Methylacidiphilales bacterium]
MARKALGRGLGALIGGDASLATTATEAAREVSIEQVIASPLQPRKTFQPSQLEELTASIREHGVIQPLIVRRAGNKYELIAGERRLRASLAAGLKKVPIVVRQASDTEVLEMALVENLQRADLDPLEEADGYALLAETFGLTQDGIAQKVGKSRAAVANALRLRSLAAPVRALVKQNHLSVGHAKVLLAISSSAQQEAAAHEVIKKELTVRQTELLVKSLQKKTASTPQKKLRSSSSSDWRDLEQQLQRSLGTRVRLVGTADKGKIEIDYYNGADLDRVLGVLGVKND